MTPEQLRDALRAIVLLPRTEQPPAVEELRARIPAGVGEAWNAAFDAGSLFDAFSRCSLAQGVYAANRESLTPIVRRPGFRVVEVGGGNGALWKGPCESDSVGEIVVVDPHPRGADGVRGQVPPGVRVTHLQASVQDAELPAADAVIFSLVLHHVAGRDREERARQGLGGAGKLEVLRAAGEAVRGRGGVVLLNEADVHCDVDLPPGDPVLAERLADSYVRRFSLAIATEAASSGLDADLVARWTTIVRDWGLGQVAAARLPIAERDVYELAVEGWLDVLDRAELVVDDHAFTDPWGLFHRYRCRPRSRPS